MKKIRVTQQPAQNPSQSIAHHATNTDLEAGETTALLVDKTPDLSAIIKQVMTTEAPFAGSHWPAGVLSLAALASMWMYVVPSLKAGQREGGEAYAILQLLGNVSCAGLVVFNIGGHYIGLLEAAQDSLKFLKEHKLIDNYTFGCCSKMVNWLHKTKLDVLILAALTATSLTTAAWFYKDYPDEPDSLRALKTFLTFAVYTLIHTLPVTFILNIPWLNFLLVQIPAAPFKLVQYLYQQVHYSREERETLMLNKQAIAEAETLRRQMVGSLFGLVEQIKASGFIRNPQGHWFMPHLPEDFSSLLQKANNGDEKALIALLPAITSLCKTPLASQEEAQSQSILSRGLHYLDRGLHNVFGIAGSLLVGGSVAGYLKVNWDLFYGMTNEDTAGTIALMAPPIVATEVLTLYYGWLAFAGAYDYISAWLTGNPKVPYAFKLNPGLSAVFLSITYFLNFFSYGTASQLVHDAFDRNVYGDLLCDSLEFSAKWGIIAYGCINMAQLLEKLVEPVAKFEHIGSDGAKELIAIMNNLKRLAALIDQIPTERLKSILAHTNNVEILNALGLDKDTAEKVIIKSAVKSDLADSTPHAKSDSSSWRNCFGLFGGGSSQRVPEHIAVNDSEVEEEASDPLLHGSMV